MRPNCISIEQFCSRNKVSYNIFNEWYKDTRCKIVEVKVDGRPSPVRADQEKQAYSKRLGFRMNVLPWCACL